MTPVGSTASLGEMTAVMLPVAIPLWVSVGGQKLKLIVDLADVVVRHEAFGLFVPPGDLDPATGRARLSYRRAAELFETATTDLPGGPYTLHQLRHSALTLAAEDGANTSTLLAYSGHTSVASLARYPRVSPEGPRPLAGRPRPSIPQVLNWPSDQAELGWLRSGLRNGTFGSRPQPGALHRRSR